MDSFGDGVHGFVGPESEYDPACFLQCLGLFPVPGNVTFQLGRPVIPVEPRLSPMFRTTVPKAPIDENRNLPLSKCDVRTNEATLDPDGIVLAKPVTETV